MNAEERPKTHAPDLSELMLFHFGMQLREESVNFKQAFSALLKNSIQTGQFVERSLPLRELFL